MNQNKLAKAFKALLSMGPVKHDEILRPTKEDMSRKFSLRVDGKGKPCMEEVE